MEIRMARSEDAPALADLVAQLGYGASGSVVGRLEAILRRPDHAVFVAVESGPPIGFVHVCLTESLEHDAGGEIRSLSVDEARRGSGIGGRLVEAAESWARERGLARMRVRSNVIRARAHRFYERRGYSVTKSQKVFDKEL